MTVEVREKQFTSGNHRMKLAIMVYRNGSGKVILVASFVNSTATHYGFCHDNGEKLVASGRMIGHLLSRWHLH